MTRRTAASSGSLREKLKAGAKKRGKPKGHWTPEVVRQRIRIGLIVNRLEKQALGELKPKMGDWMNAKGKLLRRRIDTHMTSAQLSAALALLDRCIPKAVDPIDIALSGTIIVEERDPTQRPADYHRKGRPPAPGV